MIVLINTPVPAVTPMMTKIISAIAYLGNKRSIECNIFFNEFNGDVRKKEPVFFFFEC
jgi:hypothetical protein